MGQRPWLAYGLSIAIWHRCSAFPSDDPVWQNAAPSSATESELTMSTITRTSPRAAVSPGSLARSIAIAGLIIGVVGGIDYAVFFRLTQHLGTIAVFQYIASGLLGAAAFAGGNTTAMVGFLIHFGISFVVAAVFILAASQIAFLRRTVFVSALVYGAAVNMFMSMVVLPYSATPKMTVTTVLIVHGLIGDALIVGLPLALTVWLGARKS
jgi:uncharacterized membrane protein YagU involved in acid resistance